MTTCILLETIPEDSRSKPERFTAASQFRLPVGWESIEVFPGFTSSEWDPENAKRWAELDILAAAARRNLLDELRQDDPHAAARRKFATLLKEFKDLLQADREEEVHQFLAQHPHLVSPSFVNIWSKLPLGKRVTDFVIHEPPKDYLLVELEKPTKRLFKQNGEVHHHLSQALSQIADWWQYIQDNKSTVERELQLDGISATPRSLVVIGRSSMLSEANRRALSARHSQHPRIEILTYDDLYERAMAVGSNLLGPLFFTSGPVEVFLTPHADGGPAPRS